MGRYQAYPEYKDSGVKWVGEIPKDWEVKPLFSVASTNSSKNADGVETNVLSLSYGRIIKRDVEDNFGLLPESFNTYQLVSKGDLILRLTDLQNDKRSLRVGYSNEVGIITSAYLKLVANKNTFYDRYMYRLLHSYDTTKVFYGMGGGLRQSMKFEDMKRLDMLMPSFEEQQKIANFLDYETAKIDTLIEKQQQLIQLLKEKRQAVISHAVTKGLNPNAPMKDSGVEWLGEVPEHWHIGKIKNLSHVISKGTTPSTMGAEFETSGIRFLKAENIGKGFYATSQPEFYISKQTDEQLARSRLRDRDVLVIIAGATTGQASLINEELLPANTNQAVSFIRPINAKYSEYIVYWLSTEYAQSNIWQNAVQAAQPNLSMETLGNIYIPIPPEQEVITLVFEIQKQLLRFSHVIQNAEKAIQLMQERRTALISAAVTGKIDVRNWQAPQI
ncbi:MULTISPECIES: restriction endonuclease subunit S [Shewanella]|uniref:restriction endonuclease subunit S n=1 Tax=Shewanella TaxID=22 RepID=UPI0024498B87|nr:MULTISPECIES: restriction endonuclease subunit S [Shewanella]MDH0451042.1 restriction endonuclease subunit S [Shewanella sp. GD04112]